MTVETFDPLRVVAALRAADVRHVLVGELAAMAHGAPVEADRIEICLAGNDENLERLGLCLGALEAEAVTTDDPHRVTFRTAAGTLECVELDADDAFATFEATAVEMDLGGGVHARVAPPDRVVAEIRDADDLVAVVRAASIETDDVPSFLLDEDGDEYGPTTEDVPRTPWGRIWRAFEDVDRFLTGVTEGRSHGSDRRP